MPKIIVTSRYLKSGSKQKSNYVKYIATREGSVAVKSNSANAPVTPKQQALVTSLIKDFPESKNSFAYSNYTANPTQQKASVLISEILEHNADQIATKENYVGYLAKRPGAVKFGTHGLFSQENTPIDLNAVIKEVGSHTGNVWTHVVSLRRTDAQRMGYDNLTAWRELVKRQILNIAKQSKIDLANLKWYAAFHDKETNPHVHIIIYSTNPKEGFLTKQGIEKIRSGFANDIYHDELYHLYGQQTDVHDQLKTLSSDLMKKLSEQISANQNPDVELIRLISLLYQQLSKAKGKKMYGYLKKDTKKTVDLIFARLAQNETIRQMYSQWCAMEQVKHDVYSSAKVDFPELTDNPEFKSVKNMIVKTVTAMNLTPPETEFVFEPDKSEPKDYFYPVDFSEPEQETSDFQSEFISTDTAYKIEWSDEYRRACKLFYQKKKTEEEKQECLKLFQAEADAGNVLALHDLGKLYASDFLGEPDAEKSEDYYTKALKGCLDLEELNSGMKNYLQYRIGKMFAHGLGADKNETAASEWFLKSAEAGNRFAQQSLASLYYYGKGVTQNAPLAVQWYTKAAEQDMPYSAYTLAKMYEKGESVPQDDDKAQEYYRRALSGFMQTVKNNQNNADLFYKLGRMFQNGLGTDANISKAIEFFRKAAESKNQWAEFQLGRIFLFGTDGIEPDRQQAVEWLTLSAEHGNSYAQEMLDNIKQYQSQMLADMAFSLFVNLSRVIEEDYDRTGRKIQSQVDSKLKKMIERKKKELGIKNEHFQAY